MSKTGSYLMVQITMLFCLMILLAGCSGGGSESAKTGQLVDPASSFKGATTKAVPTAANAEDLAMGGFDCTSIASAIHGVSKSSGSSTAKKTESRPVLALARILKQSVRRMELPQKAALLRKSSQPTSAAKSVNRTTSYQTQGTSGGTASYTMDINDSTGTFFGTITYQSFASDGTVVDGATDILGTFDATRQQFSRFTLSFRSLTFRSDSSTASLTGSLSWGFNFTSNTETLSMNMVLQDQASTKTYWFKNYELVTVYSGTTLTQTITGRYYDHDLGYVDLTTQTPLVAIYGDQWPSQGTLVFNGDLSRWVRMNFLANTVKIEADTNGDGSADWQVERPSNVSPPVNTAPTADAGLDQNVTQFATVHLDGSASSDKEGDPLTYTWTFVSGPTYTALTDANTATPSFTASLVGTYVLSLRVYDGNSMAYDTVSVTVTPVPAPPASHVFEKISGPTIWTYLKRTLAVDSLDQVYVTSGSTIFRVKNKQPVIFLNAATVKAAIGSSADLDIRSIDVGPDDNLYFLEGTSGKILVSDQQGQVRIHRDLRGIPGIHQRIGVIDADSILLINLYDGLYLVKGSGSTLLYDKSLVLGGTSCATEDLAADADGSFSYLPGCNGSPMVGGKSDGSGVGILLTNSISVGLTSWWNFSGVSKDPAGGFIANVGGSRILRITALGQYEIIHTDPELDVLASTSEGNDMAFYYGAIAKGSTGNIYLLSSTSLYAAHPK